MNHVTTGQQFDIFEGMTSISAVIKSIKTGCRDRRIIRVLYDSERALRKQRELHFLSNAAAELGFTLDAVSRDELAQYTSGDTHGGIIALCTKCEQQQIDDKFASSGDFFVLLEGIEDPYNFGYCIRSLYAAGVDGIVLPRRNWLEFSGVVARSSAGTSELANMCVADPIEAIKLFKDKGFTVVCAEIRDSVSIYEYDFRMPVLLVVGGEKRGISRKILDEADANVRIDYGRDFMGSLPSAAAISVISFEIARQKGKF
jgi:23S rRNA (guanosine2251-2'-O)-methyltransferase